MSPGSAAPELLLSLLFELAAVRLAAALLVILGAVPVWRTLAGRRLLLALLPVGSRAVLLRGRGPARVATAVAVRERPADGDRDRQACDPAAAMMAVVRRRRAGSDWSIRGCSSVSGKWTRPTLGAASVSPMRASWESVQVLPRFLQGSGERMAPRCLSIPHACSSSTTSRTSSTSISMALRFQGFEVESAATGTRRWRPSRASGRS